MSRFLGIKRERVFSPGRVADDGAILEMVAIQLRERGHTVVVFSAEDERWPEAGLGGIVFAMCQGAAALARLQQWQARGVRIVNHPQAILDCQRHRTIAALTRARIPFPESVLVETGAPPVTAFAAWMANGGAWLKRGDVHATQADDVVHVDGVPAAQEALRRFRERGVQQAVLQRHVPGTILKFYAVRGCFFHCVPAPGEHSVAAEVLQRIDDLGQRAAQALGVEVYGGDCVHGVDGGLNLIDLNDWPSYAACRVEAALQIAAYVHACKAAIEA